MTKREKCGVGFIVALAVLLFSFNLLGQIPEGGSGLVIPEFGDITTTGTVWLKSDSNCFELGAGASSGDASWCFDGTDSTHSTTVPTADVAPYNYNSYAGNAYSQATVNTTGGSINILPGTGTHTVTVDDFNNCSGETVTVYINADTGTVLTEGVDWTAATSNEATATSLASAISALTGVSCTAPADIAYIVLDAGTRQVSLKESEATCTTLAEGQGGSLFLSALEVMQTPGEASTDIVFDAGDDGDTLIRGGGSDDIQFYVNNVLLARFVDTWLRSLSTNRPGIGFGVTGNDTTPNICPDRSDTNTGLASNVDDTLCFTAGGACLFKAVEDTTDYVITTASPVFTPTGDQSLAADAALSCGGAGVVRIVGNGGAVVLSAAPSVSDGVSDGQVCIIQGTSDANTVQVNDNTNIQLAGGVNFVMGQGDTLMVHWDSGDSDWYEISRSDN